MRIALIAVSLLTMLAACEMEIPTNPNTFDIDQKKLTVLRRPQSVALVNGVESSAAKVKYKSGARSVTWILDRQAMTDTAIAMLGRGFAKQGIEVAASGGEKTITLRVQPLQVRKQGAQITAFVEILARFGDGTTTRVDAENMSPAGAQRAWDGAVLFALHELLEDEKFLAYMNR